MDMRSIWKRIVLIFFCCCVSIDCQDLHCLPSSGVLLLFPNISDDYFNAAGAVKLINDRILTLPTDRDTTQYFVIPTYSPMQRNCSGNVMSINYCYWVPRRERGNNVVFEVVLGNQHGSSFIVNRTFAVNSMALNRRCKRRGPARVCCDTHMLSSEDVFHIPPSRFVFGINLLGHQVRFRSIFSFSSYEVDDLAISGQQYELGNQSSTPFFLLQFSIVPDQPFTTEPEATTVVPTSPIEAKTTTYLSTLPSVTSREETHFESTSPTERPLDSQSTSADSNLPTSTTIISDDGEARNIASKKGLFDDGESHAVLIGGVSGGLAGSLVLLLVVVVSVSLVWVRLKNRRNSEAISFRGPRVFNNAIYGEGLVYADVGPGVFTNTKEEAQAKDNEYSYAEWGANQGATYEEPVKLVKHDQDVKNNTPVEEDIYMVPPSSEEALYSQLDGMAQNLLRDSLSLGDSLGSGQFGAVYQGGWRCGQEEVQVAVKTLKEGAKEEDRVKFLQEAAIMGQFKHPNVVTMYGVVREGEPILLVLELLVKGDLRGHLLKARSGTGEGMNGHILLSYCRQVVSGMVYLSSKAFVHRDLAARNILMSEDEICKIADFGMSRDLMYESFYVSHGGMIPVKWTAPEALYYKTYSTASDVWSFGALMYEIWSVGHKPFETLANNKVLSAISSGVRLAPPPGCPRMLYSIMIDCWHPESCMRPLFMDLCKRLSLPDSKLLLCSEEDRSVHPGAGKLGADLQCAEELYKDLQTKYLYA